MGRAGGAGGAPSGRKWNEIVQILVSGAPNDTKEIRKAGADISDIFTNSGPEKPKGNLENLENCCMVKLVPETLYSPQSFRGE